MKSKLQKAQLTVVNGKQQGTVIKCRFNPTEYDLETAATYATQDNPGSTASPRQFVGGEAETLSMQLFFDTTDTGEDVREAYTDALDSLLRVDGELHAPPVCRFTWGGGLDFKAFLESAKKQFTRFLPSGVPVRASVDVTLTEYTPPATTASGVGDGESGGFSNELLSAATKLESTDRTKVWTVTEGDTLWLVAAAEYDDPSHWRTIAAVNGIDNPRRLTPGTELTLPPL